MQINQQKWDQRFLALAKFVSMWSKDPSTKVGAVIACYKTIVSLGYNGFPCSVLDDPALLNNREEKLKRIIHAERNAIEHAYEEMYNGQWQILSMYTYPFMPCNVCAEEIKETGIKRIVSLTNDNPRWQDSFLLSKEIFIANNIELTLYENLIELV